MFVPETAASDWPEESVGAGTAGGRRAGGRPRRPDPGAIARELVGVARLLVERADENEPRSASPWKGLIDDTFK